MAEVGGVPRKRKSQDSNLKQEVRKRKQPHLIIAKLGIVGEAGTGRKTLAYRFCKMDVGVFEEQIPVRYTYIASEVWNSHNPNKQSSGFKVQITSYIIQEPVELTPHQPPLYMTDWDRFCCLIFIYDIQNTTTSVGYLLTSLENIRIEDLRIPVVFLVGNKHDEELQQYAPWANSQNEVEGENLVRKRFLCSAKRNIGVRPLLNEIIRLAFQQDN